MKSSGSGKPPIPRVVALGPCRWVFPDGHPRAGETCGLVHERCAGHITRGPKTAAPKANWGDPCEKAARRDQTVCATHGGSAPQALARAERRHDQEQARKIVATYGLAVDIDPHDALIQEVHRTAGHVAWLADRVASLDELAPASGPGTLTRTESGETITVTRHQTAGEHPWVTLYRQERAHLVKVCAEAIRCGVEERRVRVAERTGAALVEALRGALDDCGIPITGELTAALGRRLRLIQGEAS